MVKNCFLVKAWHLFALYRRFRPASWPTFDRGCGHVFPWANARPKPIRGSSQEAKTLKRVKSSGQGLF